MPRYIDVENLNLKGIAVFDENLDVLIPLSDVRKAIQMTPAADVAPRAEVAREIFGELGTVLFGLRDEDSGEPMLCVYLQDFEELKKKYTEGKK